MLTTEQVRFADGALVARRCARVPAVCVRACVPVCLSNTNDTVILLFYFHNLFLF
jgi:hypothetical protein